MTIAILPCRSVPLRLKLLFICMLLCLLAPLPAAAQESNATCTSADMGSYAELYFCLPNETVVEPETIAEANYTAGREVRASMLLNGSRVSLHLLYPCQTPQTELEPAAMKSLLEGYDPAFMQANYSDSMLSVSGRPALWGQMASPNQIFVAYQPTNQTPALILMDGIMSDDLMVAFLGDLRITPKEGVSPLSPGYCSDTTAVPAEANVENTPAINNATGGQVTGQTTAAEARQDKLMTSKEKMAADMEAAKEKLAEAKEKMMGY